MSEGTAQTAPGQQTSTTTPNPATVQAAQEKAFEPPRSQADLDRIVQTRLERERAKFEGFEDFKAKAAEFDKLTEQSKSELQKATERAEALDRELANERSSRLRLEVAQSKALPVELAARLRGETREELEADADALAALLPKQQATNGFRDAQGQPARAGTGDWLRDSLASR